MVLEGATQTFAAFVRSVVQQTVHVKQVHLQPGQASELRVRAKSELCMCACIAV